MIRRLIPTTQIPQALRRTPPRIAAQSLSPSFTASRFRSYSTPSDPPPQPLEPGEQAIYDKLASRFQGKQLQVQDVSGAFIRLSYLWKLKSRLGGCGSFYAILISSPAFKGLNTIKQHKLVNECLKEDIKSIHGLQVGIVVRYSHLKLMV